MASVTPDALPSDGTSSRLFVASCVALVTTAMSFAIRGDIMSELQLHFALDKTQLGWISGAAFWGFGFSMLAGGPLCDVLGTGRLLKTAALGHIVGVMLTVFAKDFGTLFSATVIIGIANGLVEAGINPLVTRVYSSNKTARLTALHAWFPGGIVIGGVLAFALTQIGFGWRAKMLLMLLPALAYTVLFLGQRFPATQRAAAGAHFGSAFRELARPFFIVLFVCMWLTSATELGPGQWISDIFNDLLRSQAQPGVLLLVWINGIMYLMRHFGRNISHAVPPTLLIALTALVAAAGLWSLGAADRPAEAFAGAALLAIGTAFWWPTMLGITAERFPRGGAVALAVIGAAGSFSTALAGPAMGWINDHHGARAVLPAWATLPAMLVMIFFSIHLFTARSRPAGAP